jgi:hypothetical protein
MSELLVVLFCGIVFWWCAVRLVRYWRTPAGPNHPAVARARGKAMRKAEREAAGKAHPAKRAAAHAGLFGFGWWLGGRID